MFRKISHAATCCRSFGFLHSRRRNGRAPLLLFFLLFSCTMLLFESPAGYTQNTKQRRLRRPFPVLEKRSKNIGAINSRMGTRSHGCIFQGMSPATTNSKQTPEQDLNSDGFSCFQLETDPNLLHSKATKALRSYGVDCVVANLLETRYKEVKLVREKVRL